MTQYKYLRGSQDSREAVEFDITRRGQYITTCVVDVDAAFERQGEENREEWGLVLVMPKEVTEAAQHLGHEHFKSSAEDNLSAGAYRQGYAEGREFDPTRRIAGGGVMNAVGS